MSIRSVQINTSHTSAVLKPHRWRKRQGPMHVASSRQADREALPEQTHEVLPERGRVQAIRKLEQVYFLERRGLL